MLKSAMRGDLPSRVRPAAGPGVEGGGDKRLSKRVRADVLSDPRPAGDPADDPGGAVPVQPPLTSGRTNNSCDQKC